MLASDIAATWLHDEGCDTRDLRNALGRFGTGVTVVTTRTASGKAEGLTVNSFAAVSLDPPLVLWSLRNEAPSLPAFASSGCFAVNVLAAGQADLALMFSRPQRDKFAGLVCPTGATGSPLLEGVLASFECVTETSVAGGDHTIFIGRVRRASYREGAPLIVSAGRFGTFLSF